MTFDLKIEIENEPGALERVTKAITDAGVNLAAATCTGPAAIAELHILVPHVEAARHALAITNVAITDEREVVVVESHDFPGEIADLAGKVAHEGINIDLLYVATRNRVVFGADDVEALRAALGQEDGLAPPALGN